MLYRAGMRHALGVAIACFVACKSADRRGPASTGIGATASGPQPIVAVAIWPARWSAIAALPQLRALGGPVPASFWDAAKQLAGEIGLESLALPPPGIDPAGAITLEVQRPHATFETIALAAAKGTPLAPDDRVGLHARVTLAAKDPAALASAFEAAVTARRGKRPELRVVRGEHAVALEIFLDDDAVPAQLVFPPATIALPFDAGHDSAARAVLRLSGLADLTATVAMQKTASAIASVDTGERGLLFGEGISEVLTGYLLIDPAGSVAGAVAADIPATGAPQVAFALVAPGKTALAAGGLAAGKTVAMDAIKWPAVIAAAPRTPLLAGSSDRDSDVATLFHQCGALCYAWVAMGNGLVLASAFGADTSDAIKRSLSRAGIVAGALAWTADDLVFVQPAGATPPSWKNAALGTPPPSAAEACYRKALVAVRSGLRANERGVAAIADADAALAGASSCVGGDAAIAARARTMREVVSALRAMPTSHKPRP